MADSPYGVYVSFRLPSGELVSSNRATVGEVRDDLKEIGFDDDFFERFVSAGAAAVNDPVQLPASQPSLAPTGPSVSEGTGSAPPGSPGAADLPANGFEPCAKCQTLKTEWRPGGYSERSGKNYSGFWGCPNYNSHK